MQIIRIKYIKFIVLTLIVLACGGKKVRDARVFGFLSELEASNDSLKNATKEQPFLTIASKGTKLGYLTPKALNTQFKRVFKMDKNIYRHCSRKRDRKSVV